MKRKPLIALHTLVWLVVLLKNILAQFISAEEQNSDFYLTALLREAAYLLVPLTAFYGSYYLVAHRHIRRSQQWWWGIVNTLAVLLLTTLVRFVVEFGFLKPVLGFDNYRHNAHFTWGYFIQNAVLYYWSYVLYGVLFGFAEHYFRQNQRQQQREGELLRAEMAFLRSQINPHFLFNSLNDLYALTLTRPAQAPPALLKLTELLRYTLYSSQTSSVLLADELRYLQNYIELENIGQQGEACIQTTFSGEVGNHAIAPMLLIPFVENALKHGAMHLPEHPVKITAVVRATRLDFYCRNYKRAGQKDTTRGIGLTNVRRRLELEYPNRHQLCIQDLASEFRVNLSLIL